MDDSIFKDMAVRESSNTSSQDCEVIVNPVHEHDYGNIEDTKFENYKRTVRIDIPKRFSGHVSKNINDKETDLYVLVSK